MKVNLNTVDRENLMVHPHSVGEETVYLIQPQHIGAKWSKDNLHFRSSVWNDQGELISASFPKFFNNGEAPDLYPDPQNHFDSWRAMEKIDGSTLIVSKYKGHLIVRTRGTVDASVLELNGNEINLLKNKYPKFFDLGQEETVDYSLIAEWTSPNNQIVIRYSEPDLYLIGKIYHENYRLESQSELDNLAKTIGVKRPQVFSFSSLKEMIDVVKEFKDKEGVCLYFNDGQNIVKIKGDWYLSLHRLKSELSSMEKVLDLYLERGQPTHQEFYDYICGIFDFELAEFVLPNISLICGVRDEVEKITSDMKVFVEPLKNYVHRKDAALEILSVYGKVNQSAFCFRLLDGKSFTLEDYKKMYLQILEK